MITQVDEFVWRGPRPAPADFPQIHAQFQTVISLEGLEEDKKEAAELPGVRVVSLPISFWQIYFKGISEDYLDEILFTIRMAKKPVLVHCQHGQDRTGLVIAAYRVHVCHWTKSQAIQEALQYGYREWPFNVGLDKTWERFTE